MVRCAEVGRVPPALGVTVNAVVLEAGLRTVSVEFATVVVIMVVPAISEVTVARPKTA